MSTQKLNQEQKDWVIKTYQDGKLNQLQIASIATVSPRTIRRIIVEAGLATPQQVIHSEAMTVMHLLKQHGVNVNMLKSMLNERKLINDSHFISAA